MLDSLTFSLNSTLPVFLVMVLGYVLNQKHFFSDSFLKVSDKLVFKVALPSMLLLQMSSIDLYSDFDIKYVLFCAGATTTAFVVIWILAKIFVKDKKIIRRICSGVIPFKCGNSRCGIYNEYLRRCRNGSAYDDRQCTAF